MSTTSAHAVVRRRRAGQSPAGSGWSVTDFRIPVPRRCGPRCSRCCPYRRCPTSNHKAGGWRVRSGTAVRCSILRLDVTVANQIWRRVRLHLPPMVVSQRAALCVDNPRHFYRGFGSGGGFGCVVQLTRPQCRSSHQPGRDLRGFCGGRCCWWGTIMRGFAAASNYFAAGGRVARV